MNHMDMQGHDMGHMNTSNHSMHMGNFKEKFWSSFVLAIPIILLSPMMGMKLPFQFQFQGSELVVAILATILFFYGGQPFLAGAKMEIKQKSPGMMTLISLGISVSYVYSIYAFIANHFLNQHVMDFFWEFASLIVIMLLGHWIEMNAVSNAGNALQKLAELLPNEVTVIKSHGIESVVSLQDVKEGDLIVVKAGDKVPTDGTIEFGTSYIDESAITGESRTVNKKVGDKVIGGSVNGDGTIQVRVTGTGENGYLAQVMKMVSDAQNDKSKLEALSDKVAKHLFYVALGAGVLSFIVWLFVDNFSMALERMVTVLIIACPHALGLAIPLVIARSTSIAAKHGLLLKNRNAMDHAYDLTTIVLDKTGTLTEGNFSVNGLVSFDKMYDEDELLKYIGALETNANHPIAKGIMSYVKDKNISIYTVVDLKNVAGSGLDGKVNGKDVQLLNAKGITDLGLSYDSSLTNKYTEQGSTLSFLVINQELVGAIALGDTIKSEAKQFIRSLHELGIEAIMATGDNKQAAEKVASYLGIKHFYSEMLPTDKEKLVAKLVGEGKKVAMVGDGINDAPSLARATVGIAIGAGTDIALESADIILTNSNPLDILSFVTLAKETHSKMVQNLWWGAGYNIIAIPLAAGILAPIGIVLSPAVGAVLMSLSTVIVAFNAMSLKMK
nr:heavy metal translocating P-type ATPase [Vagococcus vulneris]